MVKTLNLHKQSEKDVLKKLLFWKSLLYKFCEPVAKILENKYFPFPFLFLMVSKTSTLWLFFWTSSRSWFSSSIYLLFQNKIFFVCSIWQESFMFYFQTRHLFYRMQKIYFNVNIRSVIFVSYKNFKVVFHPGKFSTWFL